MEERVCDCAVCRRIQMIKEGKNPYFVKELETGYVVLGGFSAVSRIFSFSL